MRRIGLLVLFAAAVVAIDGRGAQAQSAGAAAVPIPSCPPIPLSVRPPFPPTTGGYPVVDIGAIWSAGTQLLAEHAVGCENIKGAYAQAQALLLKQRDAQTLKQLGKFSPSLTASLQQDIDKVATSVGMIDGNVVRDAKYFQTFQLQYPAFDPNADINKQFEAVRIRMWQGTRAALTANQVVTNQNVTVAGNVAQLKQLVANGAGVNEILGTLGLIVSASVDEARQTNQLITTMMAQQAAYASASNTALHAEMEINKASVHQQILQNGAANVGVQPTPHP